MRLRSGDPIWFLRKGGDPRPGRFVRYLGRGRCRVYLINDGHYSVPRSLVSVRRSRVNGRTLEVTGLINGGVK